MALHEKDPRDTAYIALLIAIKWYKKIDPEAAWRIATGQSCAKPEAKLTSELREKIELQMSAPGFHSFDALEKKFKVNRYKIIESEEKYIMGQIEIHLKKLKELTQTCNGECELCSLDTEVADELTMCEYLTEYDPKKPKKAKNRQLQKIIINCSGKTKLKTFQIYDNILKEFEKYLTENKDKKIRDIVSSAIAEYIARHK